MSDLFAPLGALGEDKTLGTRCGVYHCTLLVDEHAVPPINPDTGEIDWDSTVHYNEYDRVGWFDTMPEEWR